MRRMSSPPGLPGDRDRGAVASLLAVLLATGVLLGMAALSVDVGQLYSERRQVQNGADAAALALAQACSTASTCDTSLTGLARTYANGNAGDGATAVVTVCGSGNASLAACGTTAGPTLTQCPAAPAGAQGWVRVRTSTLTSGGQTLLPATFARALSGNGGYTGDNVRACAQAIWGVPSAATQAVPLAISACEWYASTSNGTSFAPAPPYPPYPPNQAVLQLHGTREDHTCPGSRGPYDDLPGGFGWLATNSGCSLTVANGSTVDADPGVAAGNCTDTLAGKVGQVIYLAVYDRASESGANGQYHILGFAAFYLSGYNLPSAHPTRVPSPVGGNLCTGSRKCIYGWFTRALVTPPATLVAGTNVGAAVVALNG